MIPHEFKGHKSVVESVCFPVEDVSLTKKGTFLNLWVFFLFLTHVAPRLKIFVSTDVQVWFLIKIPVMKYVMIYYRVLFFLIVRYIILQSYTF